MTEANPTLDPRSAAPAVLPPRLAVRSGHRLVLVDVGEIDWIEADDNYVTIWRGTETLTMRGPLGRFGESPVDARLFPYQSIGAAQPGACSGVAAVIALTIPASPEGWATVESVPRLRPGGETPPGDAPVSGRKEGETDEKTNRRSRSCRRDFIRQAGRAAGVGVVLGALPAAALAAGGPRSTSLIPIPTQALGKTAVQLPILAYGGAALPRVWGNPLSHEDRVKLVRYAYRSWHPLLRHRRQLPGEPGDSR